MEINVDLYSDFYKLNLEMITNLKNQGFYFEEYEKWKARKGQAITNILSSKKTDIQENDLINAYEKELVFDLANLLERIPEPLPRKIHKCRDFTCPEQYKIGFDLLEKAIKNGDNLLPYLSRGIINATRNDRMLFILGIIHFHLGKKKDQKNPLLIEGTEDILYAFIHNQDCYFIKIDKHGLWDDDELLQLLYNDFPEVLQPWKLKDVTPVQLSNNDRKNLRNKNVTTLITINNEAYIPPGWGISTAGTSMNAHFKLIRFIHYLDCLEKKLILLLNQQNEKMETDFNKKIEQMKLCLFQIEPVKIFDKENNLLIEVNEYNDDNLSIRITNNISMEVING